MPFAYLSIYLFIYLSVDLFPISFADSPRAYTNAHRRERKDQEKIKEARREKQNKLNRENKMKQWAKQSEERKRAQRRHISEKRNEVEDFIRLRNSESRFYGDTTSAIRCKQISSEGFVTTKKTSSLLGCELCLE